MSPDRVPNVEGPGVSNTSSISPDTSSTDNPIIEAGSTQQTTLRGRRWNIGRAAIIGGLAGAGSGVIAGAFGSLILQRLEPMIIMPAVGAAFGGFGGAMTANGVNSKDELERRISEIEK